MASRNMSFINTFEKYSDCTPPGVRLPEMKIESKFYKDLGVEESATNLDFLRKLCFKGVKDKGIDKLENKQAYYDRAKKELRILEE